ncbi:hypothetical protein E4Q23_11275 [Candidatus Accumulibacter phosphatis]|uniref:Uncharacterized protein n=1 Tax=Candidatus Accumulibacter phosphatis TaxID=327160 RepID=A0ABX1TYG8_9PROT|nr:hypothetical protein [Candidatus Accumulibacter phosphatis]NMQ28283.1 hypothetical protein [Candidatus Accumulibacter phosphatis]
MTKYWLALLGTVVVWPTVVIAQERLPHPVVSTGQRLCYDDYRENAFLPAGRWFNGEDAKNITRSMRYALGTDGLCLLDLSRQSEANRSRIAPFLNTKYFAFAYGFPEEGERSTDSQSSSATLYADHGSKLIG